MAIIKVKPTSPGRRGLQKVVTPDLHKGKPFAPLLEKKHRKLGVIIMEELLLDTKVEGT